MSEMKTRQDGRIGSNTYSTGHEKLRFPRRKYSSRGVEMGPLRGRRIFEGGKALAYRSGRINKLQVSHKKRTHGRPTLRAMAANFELVREFKVFSGEFNIYKNRLRDCEYEVFKLINAHDGKCR